MLNSNKTLCTLMLAAFLAAPPAIAQMMPAGGTVREVALAVVDPATGREVDLLERGDALQLALGQEVRLELVDPRAAARARHLPGTFELVRGNTGLELLRPDPARGSVIVRARSLRPGERQRAELGWRLRNDVRTEGENQRWGQLQVDVVDAPQSGSTWQAAADRAIAGLYHGILLRAPDNGAVGFRDRIAREGHGGAVRVAREIAASRESEIGVYEKGGCNQARLLAMYQHLLGIDSNGVDQRRWREQLQRMERGDIAGIVDEMVQSREFASRFGLS